MSFKSIVLAVQLCLYSSILIGHTSAARVLLYGKIGWLSNYQCPHIEIQNCMYLSDNNRRNPRDGLKITTFDLNVNRSLRLSSSSQSYVCLYFFPQSVHYSGTGTELSAWLTDKSFTVPFPFASSTKHHQPPNKVSVVNPILVLSNHIHLCELLSFLSYYGE